MFFTAFCCAAYHWGKACKHSPSLVRLLLYVFYTYMDDISLQAVTPSLSSQLYSVVMIKFYLTHISWRPLWARPWGLRWLRLVLVLGELNTAGHFQQKTPGRPVLQELWAYGGGWRWGPRGPVGKTSIEILWEWLGAACWLRMVMVWETPRTPSLLSEVGASAQDSACLVRYSPQMPDACCLLQESLMTSSCEYVNIIFTLFEVTVHTRGIFSGNYGISHFFGGRAAKEGILLEF